MTKEEFLKLIKEKQYLGDGLYFEFDGYQIILSTERETGTHYVALETEVLLSFDRARERLNTLFKIYNEEKSQ